MRSSLIISGTSTSPSKLIAGVTVNILLVIEYETPSEDVEAEKDISSLSISEAERLRTNRLSSSMLWSIIANKSGGSLTGIIVTSNDVVAE